MIIKKIVSIFLIWQIIFFSILPYRVYAQEESPTPQPSPTAECITCTAGTVTPTTTPIETPIESPVPTPSETPIEILVVEATPSATPESSPSATPLRQDFAEQAPSLTPTTIAVEQTSETKTETVSQSTSGENTQISDTKEDTKAVTKTGEAVSVANSVTVANLSEINSNLITVVETILTSETKDIDLYQKLIEAIINNPNFIPTDTNIYIDQKGEVTSLTEAVSCSGDNLQVASEGELTTGDSISLANSVTTVNTNLISSNLIIAIINILSSYKGDVILPNIKSGNPNANLTVNQSSITDASTTSTSISGENSQIATQSSSLTTGVSNSSATSLTLSNLIQIGGSLGYLIINNYGAWNGNLINWNNGGSIQSVSSGSQTFSNNKEAENNPSNPNLNIFINQLASVNSTTTAKSNSGNNKQIGGNTIMNTGDAISLANSFTLSNFTGIGGTFFFGIINIINDWSGDIITAYPQLSVNLSDNKVTVGPNEIVEYFIEIKNNGKAHAHDVKLQFNWPDGVDPVNPLSQDFLGDFDPEEILKLTVRGRVKNNLNNNSILLASATVTTIDEQDSTSNNSATDQTKIVYPDDPPPDSRTPELSVSVWNNVNDYVLAGDTIQVKISLKNNSPYIARNVKLSGKITNEHPIEFPEMNYNLGDIRAGGGGTISFNLTLKKDTLPALYHISAQAQGQSDSGNTSQSNLAVSNFLVKDLFKFAQSIVDIPEVKAVEQNLPETLGVSTDNTNNKFNYYYVFPIIILAYVLTKLAQKKLRKSS